MKNKHPKRELAIRMMSSEERARHIPPFESKNFLFKKMAKLARRTKQQA